MLFRSSNLRDSRAIVVSGTITVSAWDGSAYIETDTLTTGSYEYFTKGLRLLFTCAAATFWIDEGEQK